MTSALDEFKRGLLDELPLQIGIIPFGLVYGILGVESGMSILETCLLSVILFGGASQIVFAQLVASATPAGVILASVSTINLRHLLYGLSVASYLKSLPLRWRILLAYILTDEAYAMSIIRFRGGPKSDFLHYHLLGTGLLLFIVWQVSTISGAFLGTAVPASLQLGFAVPLSFIAVLAPVIKRRAEIFAALSAGITALILHDMVWNLWLICAAIIGIATGWAVSYLDKDNQMEAVQ